MLITSYRFSFVRPGGVTFAFLNCEAERLKEDQPSMGMPGPPLRAWPSSVRTITANNSPFKITVNKLTLGMRENEEREGGAGRRRGLEGCLMVTVGWGRGGAAAAWNLWRAALSYAYTHTHTHTDTRIDKRHLGNPIYHTPVCIHIPPAPRLTPTRRRTHGEAVTEALSRPPFCLEICICLNAQSERGACAEWGPWQSGLHSQHRRSDDRHAQCAPPTPTDDRHQLKWTEEFAMFCCFTKSLQTLGLKVKQIKGQLSPQIESK